MIVVFASPWLLPVPPDILLIPVLLAKPEKTIRLGLLAAFLYFLGWLVGYAIGYYGHLWFGESLAQSLGLADFLSQVKPKYDEWGLWAVLAGSATPLSDKLFSIGSGILRYDFGKFAIAAFLGATIRIMTAAILLKLFGTPVVRFVEKYLEWVAFGVIVLALTVYLIVQAL